MIFTYDTHAERTGITGLLRDMSDAGIRFSDLNTTQSSLEDIFVDVVRNTTIQTGCAICSGTNRVAVARIIRPRTIDLVAAAPLFVPLQIAHPSR